MPRACKLKLLTGPASLHWSLKLFQMWLPDGMIFLFSLMKVAVSLEVNANPAQLESMD